MCNLPVNSKFSPIQRACIISRLCTRQFLPAGKLHIVQPMEEKNRQVIRAKPRALVTISSHKDSFLQKLNCAINRKNNINMGGNGEDTRAYTARRVCVPEGSQEHLRIYPAGGRPAGPMQVVEGAGQVGFTALEPCWFYKHSEGITMPNIFSNFARPQSHSVQ